MLMFYNKEQMSLTTFLHLISKFSVFFPSVCMRRGEAVLRLKHIKVDESSDSVVGLLVAAPKLRPSHIQLVCFIQT